MSNLYTEFRKDGWPFCPQCGEDELFSVVMLRWNGLSERPTLEQCLSDEMKCYYCNWSSVPNPYERAFEAMMNYRQPKW